MSKPPNNFMNPHSSGQHRENVQVPLDLLNTVRLPPPTMNDAYAWGGTTNHPGRAPLSDNTNMLRTPDSIMRLNEAGGLKRMADAPTSENIKQRKLHPHAGGINAQHLQKPAFVAARDPSGNGLPIGSTRQDGSFYHPERYDERPSNSHAGTPYLQARSLHSPSSMLKGHQPMLSPSTSPYDRKTDGSEIDFLHTPTRAERPASTPDLSYDHRMFMLQRRIPNMPLMPPIPPPPASFTSSAVPGRTAPPFPSRLQQLSYQNSEVYGTAYPGPSVTSIGGTPIKHVDIPPPDQMPKIEDDGKKPTYSYAMLIGMAILRAPERKLTLSQIYTWIMDTFEFYRTSKPTWHNSIRHNLSLNKAFEKQVRPKGDSGKGNYWTIVKGLEYQFMKPRPAKRGSEALVQPSQTPPAGNRPAESIPIKVPQEPVRASTPLVAKPATSEVFSNDMRAMSSSQTHDNIPSDGTEPDERLLEEEIKAPANTGRLLVKPVANAETMKADNEGLQSHNHAMYHGALPQMHTMSSSNSRPHSPLVTTSGPDSSFANTSRYYPNSAGVAVSSGGNIIDGNREYSGTANNVNEWQGQGQFAFRCSTPSLVPLSTDSQLSQLSKPRGLLHEPSTTSSTSASSKPIHRGRPSPDKRRMYDLDEKFPNVRYSGVNPSECELKRHFSPSSQQDSPSKVVEDQHKGSNGDTQNARPTIEVHMPKTPEKLPKRTPDLNSSIRRNRLSSAPSLPPPKSLESPYAGTLELSPGVSHIDDQDGALGSSSGRATFRRHHKKKSSLHSLADFLELDFRKSDQGGEGHHRTSSDSSDDAIHHVATANFTAGPNLGGNPHMGSLALSFDVDLSPRVVVTPIRRPFDTPIRDQAHAYSPYCCRSTSSSFGSPLRRS